MTFEQMIEGFKTIELLEKDLMRDLTEKEKKVILVEGWEKFLFDQEHLGLSEDDYKEIKAIRKLVSAFYTQDESNFEKAVKECSEDIYFVLRYLADTLDRKEKECPKEKYVSNPEADQVVEFAQFFQDMYNKLPEREKAWFSRLTDDIRKKVFEVYKESRNDHQDCTDNILSGILLDKVKDCVVEDLATRLKNKEVVEMTNDEYLEVADYLCEHENRVFLSNDNGKVKLVL